jgi:hypothetical protein
MQIEYMNRIITDLKYFALALLVGATATGLQSCSETENAAVAVTGIVIDRDAAVMLPGNTLTLAAEVFPAHATNKEVVWTSDNASVASVSADGVVTAVAAGVANIAATSADNPERAKTCVVTVVQSPQVSLDKNTLQIPVGETRALVVTVLPENAPQDVVWASDNNAVVTVDNSGNVTAVALGTATVSVASAVDASSRATCTVSVIESVPSPTAMWTFEDPSNLTAATVGEPLVLNGGLPENLAVVAGPKGTGAVQLAEGMYFTVHHGIAPNGSGAGDYVNEYTLMLDIRVPSSLFGDWLSIFNNHWGNSGDGTLWIDGDGKVGYARIGGYSAATLQSGVWARLVISAKLGDSFKLYLDGALVFAATQGIEVDGDMSLWGLPWDEIYVGYDGSGYPGPDFAEIRVWDSSLSDDEVQALGAAGD